MHRIRPRADIIGEEPLDIDGIEAAQAAAVFAGDLDPALLRHRIAHVGFAQHPENLAGAARRAAATEGHGPHSMNAHVVFGEQLGSAGGGAATLSRRVALPEVTLLISDASLGASPIKEYLEDHKSHCQL